MQDIAQVIDQLGQYIEGQDFKGYDPYDALTGRWKFRGIHKKWGPAIAIQIQKRNPISLRGLMGIPRQVNPKALGLLLEAYSLRFQLDPQPHFREVADRLYREILERTSPGYAGMCWGYPFDWASSVKYLPAGTPNVVVTAFVARGIEMYGRVFDLPEASAQLPKIVPFILEDLSRHEEPGKCYISYTPVEADCCYNASLLAAEVLARAHVVEPNPEWKRLASDAVNFVVDRQLLDGRWNYSLNTKTGVEREQVDFHQGYVIDSIRIVGDRLGVEPPAWKEAVRKGLVFYMDHQFRDNGLSLYRWPKKFPVDIHHQAQGIITFSQMSQDIPDTLQLAQMVGEATIRHFFSRRKGFFYYRKSPLWTNRIPYMRWGQAWMMLALVHLLHAQKQEATA